MYVENTMAASFGCSRRKAVKLLVSKAGKLI